MKVAKNIIVAFALLFLADSCSSSASDPNIVYVCKGPRSKAYHKKKNCYGLERCSTDIDAKSKTEATIDLGRKPCGYCYK